MTIPAKDALHASHPDWLIWHVGLGAGRWWGMHKATAVLVSADALKPLTEILDALTPTLTGVLDRSDLHPV